MQKIWKAFIGLFSKIFQLVEERKQTNVIHTIGKDEKGYTVLDITAIGSNHMCQLYPHQIFEQSFLKKQFKHTDINVIKAILIAEGDIFLESKEYRGDHELFFLQSKLDDEKWMLTREQLNTHKSIFNRINKRYMENEALHLIGEKTYA